MSASSKMGGAATGLSLSAGFSARWGEKFKAAQRVVDSAVTEYCKAYVPHDTGALMASGDSGTVPGSGLVQYTAPYARAVYYTPQGLKSSASQRGPFWFERMKAAHKQEILAKVSACMRQGV